jgi:NitT/TauT family transport system permease protein
MADANVFAEPAPAEPAEIEGVRQHSFYRRNDAWLLGGGALLVLIAIWEFCWQQGWISPLFFSGPSAIAKRFVHEMQEGNLWSDIAYSGRNFAIGLGLATVTAIPLGIVLGWYRPFRLVFDPLVNALYSTPRIALIPLIIIWFGIGMWSKVFIVFLAAFFPILINTVAGVKNLDADLVRAARSFCATDRQLFVTVALPSSVPFILAGMRMAVAHALIGVVVGELFAGNEGIGYMINFAGQTFATDLLLIGVLITACAGIAFGLVFDRLQRRFQRWRPEGAGRG